MVSLFRRICGSITVALPLLLVSAPVWADDHQGTTPDAVPQGLPNPAEKNGKNIFDYTAPGGGVPKDLDARVRIEQKIDAPLPMNLEFKDESGKKVTLGQYFGRKPVMISMLQLTCDQVCSAQMQAMTASFNELQFSAGKEFEVLTVSIDPREGPLIAQDVKDERLKEYTRPSAKDGWHFLTGDEKNIKSLAKSLGIKYIWDGGSKQFIHPDGIVLATPDGHIARYFMRLNYEPRALRFSVIEASKERVGSVIDQIALSCFHYNPQTGKYSFQVMSFVRVAGLATVIGGLLGIFLTVMMEKRRGRGAKASRRGSQLKKA
ncbi:protein SCO1/2 [Abditibacterium utsteinense]|uniref:Protein SCO1/2 n=1 Tax=Abditibacterium utsteinense TaxID=1960156 RepID=A0A2S8SV04_9BACT|nr:SCO family protein [Abditibacterium utsteinense]PQV64621.1 protein SCO1/2 [Abditibacterium utsteinense]